MFIFRIVSIIIWFLVGAIFGSCFIYIYITSFYDSTYNLENMLKWNSNWHIMSKKYSLLSSIMSKWYFFISEFVRYLDFLFFSKRNF